MCRMIRHTLTYRNVENEILICRNLAVTKKNISLRYSSVALRENFLRFVLHLPRALEKPDLWEPALHTYVMKKALKTSL